MTDRKYRKHATPSLSLKQDIKAMLVDPVRKEKSLAFPTYED